MTKPVDGAEALAREVLARACPGLCLNESEKQGVALAMLAHSAALAAENERLSVIADQAQFLCDRLDELDWCEDLDALANDYSGHVDPPLHRLKTALETRNG